MDGPVLTKKQQKALTFRSKQKAKKLGKGEVEQEDVPEEDLILDDEAEDKAHDAEGGDAEGSKKRKRDDKLEAKSTGDKSVKGKGKAKTAWDDENEEKDVKKSKKEVKQRFILFVGNLDYKTTKAEVQQHFTEAVGHQPAVRLLTTKPTTTSSNPRPIPKSRGIAFLELNTSTELQACLKLHHSNIKGRIINVELTAGGGGGSEKRKEKIKERNGRVGVQRERRAEREGVEGEAEGVAAPAADKEEVAQADGNVKMRGERRVKVKPKGDQASTNDKRGGASDKAARWGGAQGSGQSSRQGGYGGKKRFEPTGANAVSVK